MDENLRREIILDNYEHPFHKDENFSDDSFIKINTNNESCIDDLDIYFKLEKDIITEAYFKGEACTISTSATSIMLKKLIGKSLEEAKKLLINYRNMINEEKYDEELLGELLCYSNIYLQPNRKGCALLPSKAVDRLIEDLENGN